jgi:hypothetical protein
MEKLQYFRNMDDDQVVYKTFFQDLEDQINQRDEKFTKEEMTQFFEVFREPKALEEKIDLLKGIQL